MKKVLSFVTIVVVVLVLSGCGKKDVLKGTWGNGINDYFNATWTFDGKGNVTLKTDDIESKGSYKINDQEVTIELDVWEESKVYKFVIDNDTLTLAATDFVSPSYINLKKD